MLPSYNMSAAPKTPTTPARLAPTMPVGRAAKFAFAVASVAEAIIGVVLPVTFVVGVACAPVVVQVEEEPQPEEDHPDGQPDCPGPDCHGPLVGQEPADVHEDPKSLKKLFASGGKVLYHAGSLPALMAE
jgi:hypothetical protein